MFVSVNRMKTYNIIKNDLSWCRKEKKWVDHQDESTDFDFINEAQETLILINDDAAKLIEVSFK